MKEEILILDKKDSVNYRFGFKMVLYGLFSLVKDHYLNFFKLIEHVFKDYFAKQYERKPAFRIDCQLDGYILPQPKALGAYFDLFPFLVGSFGFVKKYTGKSTQEDLNRMLRRLVDFYSDAGSIFENAPTTLLNRKTRGWSLKILHSLDRPRNFFPSLHVVTASYVYFGTLGLIDKYPTDYLDSSVVKQSLFDRMIRIIEACLLTKQHGIRDIAGGLALVSIREPEFKETAYNIMGAMFKKGPFALSDQASGQLKEEIERIYAEIIGCIGASNVSTNNHPQFMAEYIKTRMIPEDA